jgi:prepilin signal peptidase PulO-like enzyme (type II secretory pathway)
MYYGFSVEMIALTIFFSIILVLTFIDIGYQVIPNNLLIIASIPVLIYILTYDLNNWIDHAFGGIVLVLIFLLIGYLGKLAYKVESLGMGDIKYAGLIGLLLGLKLGILSFVLSFFLAALVVLFMAITKKVRRKQKLAFGPFLSLGCFIALFWGNNIIEWYINLYRS